MQEKKKKTLLAKIYRMRALYLLLLIPALQLIVFHYAPFYGLIIAFKKFKYADGIMGSSWVGLWHFDLLFNDVLFKRVFINTIRISLSRIFLTFPLPIIFALLLNEIRNTAFKKTVQTISYLPHFMSWVIIGNFAQQLLSPEYGALNALLGVFGKNPIYFLGTKSMFLPILLIAQTWQGLGWGSIIYLAAMSSVDPALYESAELDGANRVHKAIYITLPSIAPIIVIQFILRFSSVMSGGFDPIFNLYNGLTMEVADVIDTYSYRAGLIDAKYDYATAIGLFQNVIGLGMVILVNKISQRVSDYGIW